jgi:ATP-dependent RNA helicase DDX21
VLNLNEIEVVCIDEADTMLEKGFKLDIERIFDELKSTAGKTQNLMFSATIPPWVAGIVKKHMSNMERINLIKDS